MVFVIGWKSRVDQAVIENEHRKKQRSFMRRKTTSQDVKRLALSKELPTG